MASMIVPIPRPISSTKMPKMNLPVIQHPSTKLGDKKQLNIRGESRQAPVNNGFESFRSARENTFVSLNEGNLTLGLDRKNLPPLRQPDVEPVGRSQPMEEGFPLYSYGWAPGMYK